MSRCCRTTAFGTHRSYRYQVSTTDPPYTTNITVDIIASLQVYSPNIVSLVNHHHISTKEMGTFPSHLSSLEALHLPTEFPESHSCSIAAGVNQSKDYRWFSETTIFLFPSSKKSIRHFHLTACICVAQVPNTDRFRKTKPRPIDGSKTQIDFIGCMSQSKRQWERACSADWDTVEGFNVHASSKVRIVFFSFSFSLSVLL